MQIDLWQRRLGWVGLLAIILSAGGLAQVRDAAAEDADAEKPVKVEVPAVPVPNVAPAAPTGPGVAAEAMKQAQEAQAQAMQQMQAQQSQIQQHVQAIQAENQQRMQESQEMNQKHAEEIRALVNRRLYGGGESGKFWLGVECKETSPELRAQLDLDDGQGLVVVRIAPDSPAEKAGLKQHDVLVSVDETKLVHVQDLSKAANAGNGKTIELRVFRSGKDQLMAITPAQRTVEAPVQIIAQPGMGMVMPGNVQMQFRLPDNMQVSIDRKGNEPAKITVKRGGESWEATADDLSKLPDDVRPFIQQMLGGFPGRISIQNGNGINAVTMPGMTIRTFPVAPGQPPMPAPMAPGVPGAPAMPMAPNAGTRIGSHIVIGPGLQNSPELMERLEQVSQQLERTQKELQRLRETIPSGPAPAEDQPHAEKP